MIRALIVDDEPKNIRILNGLIEKFCPQVEICGNATTTAAALAAIEKQKPDLVFLDIEMPHGNTFDMLDKLMPVTFEIIFITAFDEYTLKAFKYSALDYLLKPVNIEELKDAVARTENKLSYKNSNEQVQNLLSNLKKTGSGLQKLALPYKGSLIFIAVNEIIRCETKNGHCHFFATGNRKFLGITTIKEYEEMLPADIFFRIHNSHLINLNHVSKYSKGRGGLIEMTDGVEIEVAIRRKDEFLARFGYR